MRRLPYASSIFGSRVRRHRSMRLPRRRSPPHVPRENTNRPEPPVVASRGRGGTPPCSAPSCLPAHNGAAPRSFASRPMPSGGWPMPSEGNRATRARNSRNSASIAAIRSMNPSMSSRAALPPPTFRARTSSRSWFNSSADTLIRGSACQTSRTRFHVHVFRIRCTLKIAAFVVSPAGAGSASWRTKSAASPPKVMVMIRPVFGIFRRGRRQYCWVRGRLPTARTVHLSMDR
jgi:hypothetical protein